MIQLEDNNPLYYFDGKVIIDYATWLSMQSTPQQNSFGMRFLHSQTIPSRGSIIDSFPVSLLNIPDGMYKVTMQRHAYNNTSGKTDPSILHLILQYGHDEDHGGLSTWVTDASVLASTSVVPEAMLTGYQTYDPLGSITVVAIGLLNISGQTGKILRLVQEGTSGVHLGGSVPYGGEFSEGIQYTESGGRVTNANDFIMLEKVG
jgi:hypothetical protein